MAILKLRPYPIAETIEGLKVAMDDASRKKHLLPVTNSQTGELPCLTAAPIAKKTADHSFSIGLDTTDKFGGKLTVVVADYGVGVEHTTTKTNSITVTFQEWPWALLPTPSQVAVAKPVDSETSFVYCQGKGHQVDICKVQGKLPPAPLSNHDKKNIEQVLMRKFPNLDIENDGKQ